MKTIIIPYISNDKNILKLGDYIDYFATSFHNPVLNLVSNEKSFLLYDLKNKNNQTKDKVNIVFSRLDLNIHDNDFLKKFVYEIIDSAYDDAKILSNTEPIDTQKTDVIFGIIVSVFNNYFSYYDISPEINGIDTHDIIDLANEIFIKILLNHPLNNGNKRMATCLLFNLMYCFGFCFKWFKGLRTDWEMFETNVIKLIEYKTKTNDYEGTKKPGKNFILENIMIALNFIN